MDYRAFERDFGAWFAHSIVPEGGGPNGGVTRAIPNAGSPL